MTVTALSLAPSAGAADELPTDLEPYVESWRVVASASRDAAPISDATVRLRVGERRVIASGEAADVDAALDDAVRSALTAIAREEPGVPPLEPEALRSQCGLLGHRDEAVEEHRLAATAVHQDALLGRLAVLLNTHKVTRFSYDLEPGGVHATIAVQVRGGRWDVERVAHRLRRVVGVLSVVEVR